MKLLLELLLRLFGLFWIAGGAFVLRYARLASQLDRVLDAMQPHPEDRLVSRFLWVGGLLTLLSGLGLALASRWAIAPLAALIASQLAYIAIQDRRFRKAETDAERTAATVAASTVRAFGVSLGVGAAVLVGVHLGALR